MVIDDIVFGRLTFDSVWSKNAQVILGGKEVNINILIAGDEEGEFEAGHMKLTEC